MSLRSITREPPDFVIQFVTDGSVMVRQKQHIYTDGKVKLGGTSIVASSDEVVIASGDCIRKSARTRMETIDHDQALPN